MAAREVVRLTEEATWGTFDGSATNIVVAHLPAGNSSTVRVTPAIWKERSAGGNNRQVMRGTQQANVGGTFMTKLFPSQAKKILKWGLNLSGTRLDLPSFTLDHRILREDGTFDYRRYLGCKFGQFSLKADNTTGGTVVQVSGQITGKQPATITISDLAEPAYGTSPTYPTDNPFAFQQLSGNITIGSALANFASMALDVDNKLAVAHDEGQYPSAVKWCGRDCKLTVKARYLAGAWRTALEAQSAKTITFTYTDGTTSAAFALNTANYLASVADDLPFEAEGYYQSLVFENLFDATAGTVNDLSATVTP